MLGYFITVIGKDTKRFHHYSYCRHSNRYVIVFYCGVRSSVAKDTEMFCFGKSGFSLRLALNSHSSYLQNVKRMHAPQTQETFFCILTGLCKKNFFSTIALFFNWIDFFLLSFAHSFYIVVQIIVDTKKLVFTYTYNVSTQETEAKKVFSSRQFEAVQ